MASTPLMMFVASLTFAAPAQELKVPQNPAGKELKGPACANNLTLLARQSVLAGLPVGHRLLHLAVENVCVPTGEGRLQAEAQMPASLHAGRNDMTIFFEGRNKRRYAAAAVITLQTTVAAKAAMVMARGAEVKVVVRTGNVTVQASAVAQEAAGLGEVVQVLPTGATRVVRGRVLDARTVEVTL